VGSGEWLLLEHIYSPLPTPRLSYSYRNATIGSTRVARRAGM
jgi:hypothetical protein